MSDHPHFDAAYDYAWAVVEGDVVAAEITRRACQRFIDDLDREGFPYWFDVMAAEAACEYIERLPHIKGEWAKRRELLVLQPWQSFIVCNVFGWKDGNGLRRFRTVYVEVARKNAKSTLAAAIALYMLDADGEAGAEVYSAATTRNQAKIVFSVAQGMARRTTALPLEVRAHNINRPDTASKFEALHAQGETLDGYNIHCAINDELHAWKNRGVYDVIETATGSRTQPIIFNITTAGSNTNGICYDLRRYAVRVVEGAVEDESFFGIIYTLDKDDDWTDESVWPKANPNWNVSVYPMDMRALAKKARDVISQQNTFLTKRLNVWTAAAEAWMDMRQWEACRDDRMELEDFLGEPCYVGIDLASKIDMNSQAQLFSRTIDGEEHVFAFMRHWLPEEAVRDDVNNQYDGWVRAEYIRTTPGNVIDVDRIEDDTMEEIAGPYRLLELAVDPGHNSTQYGVHMAEQGITTIDVRPTVLNFSEAMKWLEAYVKDGRFHHNCPVLTWMVSNVEVKRDHKDNIYPRKSSPDRKIDGVIALLMALNRLKLSQDKNRTVYDQRGVITV